MRQIKDVTQIIGEAQRNGLRVSTEAYPYGASSTTMGAPFLSPEALSRSGRSPTDIFVVDTADWVKDAEVLARIRRERPGAIVVIHHLREDVATDRALLEAGCCFQTRRSPPMPCLTWLRAVPSTRMIGRFPTMLSRTRAWPEVFRVFWEAGCEIEK
jgi:hypothetical protein